DPDVQAQAQLDREAPYSVPVGRMRGGNQHYARHVGKLADHAPATHAQNASAEPAREPVRPQARYVGRQRRQDVLARSLHPPLPDQSQSRTVRPRLIVLRSRLASMRRALAARLGLVAARFFGAVRPDSMNAASRSRASWRLRSWVRKRWALSTSTPSSVRRRSRLASRRSRTASGSDGELATSKRSSTAVATLLTFCPPGPDARTKRSTISASGISMADGVVVMGVRNRWPARRSARSRLGSRRGSGGLREECQRACELHVRRRHGVHAPRRIPWMRERQLLRVQQHAVDVEHAEAAVVAAVAVAGVADQMMRKVLEVAADLAEAPGLRPGAQQRVARGLETAGRNWKLGGGE